MGGATVPLTVDELESLRADLRAALEPYVARLADRTDWPAETRFVRILLAGTPLDQAEETDDDDSR